MISPTQRLYYLDWLRVAAFAILILFHSWQPFTHFDWLIKSEQRTLLADVLTVFFHTWRLHLIFFVSGVGTWMAMRSRGRSFFRDRVLRLIVPFVFGAIVVVPVQYYYQQLQQGPSVGFGDFLLHYPSFQWNKRLGYDPFQWILEIGIHLWYLPYLFIMTLVAYPLLKRISSKGISEKLLGRLERSPRLLLWGSVPIILARIIWQPVFPEYTSVADFIAYGISFLYGYLFIREHARLLPIVQRNGRWLLILGILSSLSVIACLLIDPLREAAFNPHYTINHVIVSLPIGLSAFSWTLYFVSLFSRRCNVADYRLAELNRSILPVYIVHQTVIVVGGFYIIKYVANGWAEFLLIVLVTVLGSWLLYGVIRRVRGLRWLFGMKG